MNPLFLFSHTFEMGIKIPPLLLLFYAFLIALRPAGFHSLVQIPGSMPSPRPLCASQFTLVNYACSTLPLSPLPGASPIDDPPFDPFPDSDYEIPDHDHHRHHSNSPSHHHRHHSSSSAHGRDHSPSERSHHHHHHENHDHRSRQGSEHRHHEDRGHGHEHRHHDDRGHRHEHRHHRHQEDECCRWLRQVDPQCVCNVLVHLPTFLSRPNHIYTAVVGDSCNVTFACGGRLRP